LTFDNKNGYTNGMKTAISIPDNVFKEVEKFARKAKKSRSQLYVEAITEYMERHASDAITDAMNNVTDKLGNIENTFATQAARKILNQEQW
jgi:metal-responsive CopG/Arc/MetJ family transcriptional regulator